MKFSSFHLHPHKCSNPMNVVITKDPSQHSIRNHLRTESPHQTRINTCCDVSIQGRRHEELNSILKKFQQLNEEVDRKRSSTPINEMQLNNRSEITTPLKSDYNSQDKRMVSISTEEKPQKSPQPVEYINTTPKKNKQEQFIQNHRFNNLTEQQQQIIWKLSELMDKADNITSMCASVARMIVEEQNVIKPIKIMQNLNQMRQQPEEIIIPPTPEPKKEGITLNQALNQLNTLIQREKSTNFPMTDRSHSSKPKKSSSSVQKYTKKKPEKHKTNPMSQMPHEISFKQNQFF